MRILMLGNSFTTANHMPDMLDELTGAAMSLSVCILALSVYFVLKFIQKRGRE